MKTETIAKLACAYSGLVWGLFWMPLRGLEAAGIKGLWAALLFNAVPFVLALPWALWRWRPALQGGLWLQAIAFTSAFGFLLYSTAMLYTSIINAMLLFYLTPLWSTLLTRFFLGEAITPLRWASMGVGFLGMLVIFQADSGIPLPRSGGDWIALASGFLWSVSSVLMRADHGRTATAELFTHNFLWAGLISLIFVLLLGDISGPSPPLATYAAQLPWLVPVIVVVVMSGSYATMWGAPKLNPGLVGLLFMTEISVGAVTAAIWSGEPFGAREVLGVILITGAGIMESVFDLVRSGRRALRAG